MITDLIIYSTAGFLVVLGITLVIGAIVDWIDDRLGM